MGLITAREHQPDWSKARLTCQMIDRLRAMGPSMLYNGKQNFMQYWPSSSVLSIRIGLSWLASYTHLCLETQLLIFTESVHGIRGFIYDCHFQAGNLIVLESKNVLVFFFFPQENINCYLLLIANSYSYSAFYLSYCSYLVINCSYPWQSTT